MGGTPDFAAETMSVRFGAQVGAGTLLRGKMCPATFPQANALVVGKIDAVAFASLSGSL
jgi:hypothetical protein